MLEITFEDLENVRFTKDSLDIILNFNSGNCATLHFSDYEEYKHCRDYLVDLFIC